MKKTYYHWQTKLKQGGVSLLVVSLFLLTIFLVASVVILSRESGVTILKTRADNSEVSGGDFSPDADIEALCGTGQATRFTKTFLVKTNLDGKTLSVDLRISPLKKSYAVSFAKVTITFDNKKIKLSRRIAQKYFEKAIYKSPPEEANQTGKIVIVGSIGITQSPITTTTTVAGLQFERLTPDVITTELVIKNADTEIVVTPAQTAENTASNLKVTF